MEGAIAAGGIVCNRTVSHARYHDAIMFDAKSAKILKRVMPQEKSPVAQRHSSFNALRAIGFNRN
jgi:hypothetical protein